MAETLLAIRGLSKRFGGLLANDRVDLDVVRGETHAIIGPNGAGKTRSEERRVGKECRSRWSPYH